MQKILDCFVAFGSSQRRRRYRGHLRCHSGAPRRGEPGIHVAACRAVRWIPGTRCARPGMTSEGGAMRSLLSLRGKRPVADAQRSKAEAIQRYAEDSGLLRRLRLLAMTGDIEATSAVIPGRPKGEPGIHLAASVVVRWILGLEDSGLGASRRPG